jgi:hypothetical protein
VRVLGGTHRGKGAVVLFGGGFMVMAWSAVVARLYGFGLSGGQGAG